MVPTPHSAPRRHQRSRFWRSTRRWHRQQSWSRCRSAALVAGTVLAAGTLATACSGEGGGGSTARFCAAVDEHRGQLFGRLAEPVTPATVRGYIGLVASVGKSAPLEIEPDWQAWALTLETFYSDTDVEHIKAMGYASQKSALAIDTWLRANCGTGVGVPIGTLPPGNLDLPVPESSEPPTTG